MKLLFGFALGCAILWTAFIVFANMMKSSGTGDFVGGGTIAVAWLVAGVVGIVAFG
jgi:hypothetical protein